MIGPSRRLILVTLAGLGILSGLAGLAAGFGVHMLNALTSRKGYAIRRDLAYGVGARRRLDLYLPEGMTDRTPVIVFFYGGSWQGGSKETYLFVGQAFAAAGFAVAIPDYRVYPEVTFPAFVEDAAAAVAFVHRRMAVADGAARPLILAGHSAGAQIAMLLLFDKHYLAVAGLPVAVKTAVGLSGPYDFLPLTDPVLKKVFPEPDRPLSQPIRFVEGTEPAVLLLTGDADATVEPANSTRLAARVREMGGSAEVKIYPGVNHIGSVGAFAEVLPIRNRQIVPDVLAFIRSRLG